MTLLIEYYRILLSTIFQFSLESLIILWEFLDSKLFDCLNAVSFQKFPGVKTLEWRDPPVAAILTPSAANASGLLTKYSESCWNMGWAKDIVTKQSKICNKQKNSL